MPISPRKSFAPRPQNATTTHVPVLPNCAGRAWRGDGRAEVRISASYRFGSRETDHCPVRGNRIGPHIAPKLIFDKGCDANPPPIANVVARLKHLLSAGPRGSTLSWHPRSLATKYPWSSTCGGKPVAIDPAVPHRRRRRLPQAVHLIQC